MTGCIFCRLFNALSLYIAREWQIQDSWELEGMFLHWFEYGRLLILKAIKTYAFVFLNM